MRTPLLHPPKRKNKSLPLKVCFSCLSISPNKCTVFQKKSTLWHSTMVSSSYSFAHCALI